MSQKSVPLYTVKGYQGAHLLLGLRESMLTPTPGAEPVKTVIASVQLIGAPLPYSVPASDCIMFMPGDALKEGDPITLLAQEAITVYALDPGRVQRAADLVRNPYAVQNAQRDELDEPIPPSLKVQCVKGSKGGWYLVRAGFCQCPDHLKGHTCKHRIAAWMRREAIIRPLAKARRIEPAKVLAELVGLSACSQSGDAQAGAA